MDEVTAATLKVVIDGQAYLWAHQRHQEAELYGQTTTPEQFRVWEDEWKADTAELIQELLDQNEE